MSLLRHTSRALLAAPFIADGVDAIRNPEPHIEKFEKVTPTLERIGLPPVLTADARLLARVSAAMSVAAGLGLALGKAPRACAAFLAVLNLPIAVINHPVWTIRDLRERNENLRGLLRSGALAGGLLLAAADYEGRPSLQWRYQAWQATRAGQQNAAKEAQPRRCCRRQAAGKVS